MALANRSSSTTITTWLGRSGVAESSVRDSNASAIGPAALPGSMISRFTVRPLDSRRDNIDGNPLIRHGPRARNSFPANDPDLRNLVFLRERFTHNNAAGSGLVNVNKTLRSLQ